MATGTLVTVGAALLPGRSATKVAPVAALGTQSAEPELTRRVGRGRIAAAVVLGALGVLLTVNGMGHVSGTAGFLEIAAACAVSFLALLALGPLIAPPVIAFYGWLCSAVLRSGATRLAVTNARRNPHRVAATTAALSIGMTVMTIFTVVASSAQASATSALDAHYPFDYSVRAADGRAVPPRIISALAAAPQLDVVAPSYSTPATVDGVPRLTWARSAPAR
jgi:putative ABC transport system permease protein